MFKEQREEVTGLQEHFKKNQKIREYSSHVSKVHSVDWSCDGKRLASGSLDKTVCLFTLSNDRLSKEHTLRGHSDSVDQLTWHPTDPELLTTASADRSVRIWESRSSKAIATIPTKGENINIAWSPDGKTIATGNKEDLVTFIDVRSHKIITEEQFKFEVNEIKWNNDSNLFFLTSGQGLVHVLSYPELKQEHVLPAHPANCICIEFDPTGKYFGVGSADALVSLWDVNDLACVRTFYNLEWPVRTISFSHDGKLISSASEDLCISVAHVETGTDVAKITVTSPTFSIAWHPKRYLLAYACDDKDKYDRDRDSGSVKVWGFPSDD